MSDKDVRFFASGAIVGLARPLAITVLWAFAAALAAALIVGLAALIVGVVTAVIWIVDRSISITGAMRETLMVTAWVLAPIALAAAVWAAAYGTTRSGSLGRTLIAAPIAIGVALALLFLDSSGILAAALGIGWALAIPSGSFVQIAARGLPLLVASLVVPEFGDLSTGVATMVLLSSPFVAAAVVYLCDLPWSMRKVPTESN